MAESTIRTINRPVETKALAKDISAAHEHLLELAEADGTFRRAFCGKDPDDNIEPVELDANHYLRIRPYEPYKPIEITDLATTWTICVENSTANSIMRVWVEIWKYATDNATSGVDIRFDDGTDQHTIVNNLQVMTQTPGHKYGPYHLGNGWSIDMRTNLASRCRCIATIEHYGLDSL